MKLHGAECNDQSWVLILLDLSTTFHKEDRSLLPRIVSALPGHHTPDFSSTELADPFQSLLLVPSHLPNL